MTKQEREELQEIKKILQTVFQAKYNNGAWRSARAEFEGHVKEKLENIDVTLVELKNGFKQIPDIKNEVKDVNKWRGKINKVLASIATMIGTILTAVIIYYFTKG